MQQSIYKITVLSLFFFGMLNAQTQKDIHDTLKLNDSLLFDRAFNHCETQYLEQLIAPDLEFYHDIAGVTHSKTDFIKVMKAGICNPNNQTTSRRELVKGSLKTFSLKDKGQVYGALQNGTHKFFENTNGVETAGSIAKFSHLWMLKDGQWLLKRVISYDHKSQTPKIDKTITVNKAALEQYTGYYMAPKTGEVKITAIKNGLLFGTKNMSITTKAKSNSIFFSNSMPLTFEFIKDSSGKVIKFLVRENNNIVEEAIKQ